MLRKALSRTYMTSPHPISKAAMLVIGDEVLNGKIKDTNSQYFAQYCFELGIDLRRIVVVPDEEAEIVGVLNDMRKRFDFIVTTGGIGPTHDDITYQSIAKAFGLPVSLHAETVEKMNRLAQNPPSEKSSESSELKAQLRMATFPEGPNVIPHYVCSNLWVPVVSIDHKVYIFPGIPALYRQMMEGLRPFIAKRVTAPILFRRYVSTTTPESVMAPLLSKIHNDYAHNGVKIGSYPHFHDKRNTVSILGPDSKVLDDIVAQVINGVQNGKEISAEEESKSS